MSSKNNPVAWETWSVGEYCIRTSRTHYVAADGDEQVTLCGRVIPESGPRNGIDRVEEGDGECKKCGKLEADALQEDRDYDAAERREDDLDCCHISTFGG